MEGAFGFFETSIIAFKRVHQMSYFYRKNTSLMESVQRHLSGMFIDIGQQELQGWPMMDE